MRASSVFRRSSPPLRRPALPSSKTSARPSISWRRWWDAPRRSGRRRSSTLADFTLPSRLPVTLPSELVHQRPDILAAEATLHSACANIGVATANHVSELHPERKPMDKTLPTSPSSSEPPVISGASAPPWPSPYSAAGPCGISARQLSKPIMPLCPITGRLSLAPFSR